MFQTYEANLSLLHNLSLKSPYLLTYLQDKLYISTISLCSMCNSLLTNMSIFYTKIRSWDDVKSIETCADVIPGLNQKAEYQKEYSLLQIWLPKARFHGRLYCPYYWILFCNSFWLLNTFGDYLTTIIPNSDDVRIVASTNLRNSLTWPWLSIFDIYIPAMC